MEALLILQGKLQDLKNEDIIFILEDAFNEVANQIEEKNREQLREGERADGSVLPNYSPVSVAVYGKPAGPIKLYDTGAFYAAIKVTADPEGVEVTDTDAKTQKLIERFGELILGIQAEKWSELKGEALVPAIQDGLKKYFRV